MDKGDIINGEKTVHPIVFIERVSEIEFWGCILTHSKKHSNNIALKSSHFHEVDKTGQPYKVQFEDSFFVHLKLIKKNDWGPFKKTGRLTDEGIRFVVKLLGNERPTYWNDYI